MDIIVFIKTGEKLLCKLLIDRLPCLKHSLIALFFSTQTATEVHFDLINRLLSLFKHLLFLCRHGHIGNGNRHRSYGRIVISGSFDKVKHFCSTYCTMCIDNAFEDLL